MLLQLENRLGKVEYIIDGEPTSGFEGVSKSGDDSFTIHISSKYTGDALACRIAYQCSMRCRWRLPLCGRPMREWSAAVAGRLDQPADPGVEATDEGKPWALTTAIFLKRYKEIKTFADLHSGQPRTVFVPVVCGRPGPGPDLSAPDKLISCSPYSPAKKIMRGDGTGNYQAIEKSAIPPAAGLFHGGDKHLTGHLGMLSIHYGDKIISRLHNICLNSPGCALCCWARAVAYPADKQPVAITPTRP